MKICIVMTLALLLAGCGTGGTVEPMALGASPARHRSLPVGLTPLTGTCTQTPPSLGPLPSPNGLETLNQFGGDVAAWGSAAQGIRNDYLACQDWLRRTRSAPTRKDNGP